MLKYSVMRLHTKNLVKRYRNKTVVKRVSIEVEQGEIVGLLGPNGAGKTTTFYMIVGLIAPNSGNIYIDEKEITKEPVYKRAKMGKMMNLSDFFVRIEYCKFVECSCREICTACL